MRFEDKNNMFEYSMAKRDYIYLDNYITGG